WGASLRNCGATGRREQLDVSSLDRNDRALAGDYWSVQPAHFRFGATYARCNTGHLRAGRAVAGWHGLRGLLLAELAAVVGGYFRLVQSVLCAATGVDRSWSGGHVGTDWRGSGGVGRVLGLLRRADSLVAAAFGDSATGGGGWSTRRQSTNSRRPVAAG